MIYVASSWRNQYQQAVVKALREAGEEVYDFRNPAPGDHGFHWSEIDPDWKAWDPKTFREALQHPIAVKGFATDFRAIRKAWACVLVLPAGRSAHLEAGWFIGMGKPLWVYMPEPQEPELMYRWADDLATNLDELIKMIFPGPDAEVKPMTAESWGFEEGGGQ